MAARSERASAAGFNCCRECGCRVGILGSFGVLGNRLLRARLVNSAALGRWHAGWHNNLHATA